MHALSDLPLTLHDALLYLYQENYVRKATRPQQCLCAQFDHFLKKSINVLTSFTQVICQ